MDRLRQAWGRRALGLGLACALGALAWAPALPAEAAGPGAWAQPRGAVRPPASERVLWALYTIGSDFEDDVAPKNDKPDEEELGLLQPQGASTDDLREVVSVLMRMPPQQRARVGVLVCFGGARKAGWRGSRVVNGDLLVEDAQDGYFGNLPDARYLMRDPQANMAEPKTLAAFLALVKREAAGAPVVLELGGHGQSYEGMGSDTNQARAKRWIALNELAATIKASGLKGPILAFSACLMASVEVGLAVGDQFRYMVASEDTMGLMGWNYETTFAQLGRSPALPWDQVARAYADSIVDDPGAAKESDKTGSVVDLAKAKAVGPLLEAWAQAVLAAGPEARAVLQRVSASTGKVGDDGDFAVGVDAEGLLRAYAKRYAPLRGPSEALARALSAAVLHHRADASRAHALGWSIYPPSRPLVEGAEAVYPPEVAASPSYWRLVQAMSVGRGQTRRGALQREE